MERVQSTSNQEPILKGNYIRDRSNVKMDFSCCQIAHFIGDSSVILFLMERENLPHL